MLLPCFFGYCSLMILCRRTSVKGLSNMIMQLRKVCNHPFVFEAVESAINPSKINNDYLWRTAGKFELLDRVLPKFFVSKHRVCINIAVG